VVETMETVPAIERLIRDGVGHGPYRSDEHLF